MDLRRVLRSLLIALVVLLGALVGCMLSLDEALPPDLLAWHVSHAQEADASPFALGLYVAFALSYLVGLVGLLAFQRWARWVFLFANLASLTPIYGPVVEHEWTAFFGGCVGLLSGAILGLVFFTAVLDSGGDAARK